jgi:two-component system, NtrC family, response regulator AtoC
VKSLLLVLTVIRSTETRSMVRRTLEEVGHRVIEANGYSQVQSLLSNGLIPDLLLIESTAANETGASELRLLLRNAAAIATCLIVESAEQQSSGRVCGVDVRHVLLKPVKQDCLLSMIDILNRPSEASVFAETSVASSIRQPTAAEIPAGMPEVPFLEELGDCGYFLAASPKMLEIRRQVKLIADADVNVLILGESGTGKEVVAHLIHKYSQRARHRFLKVNCAALPAELLESELFGHLKGAFTGAIKDRPGKFEQANHGTLLLDEIGEMSAHMQAKLLHVLQDGQFTRLGGQEAIRSDLRVLAATNVPIESALKEKKFREDLYYRLSVFTLSIPPLRERREEIPYLIDETIRRAPAEVNNGNENHFSARLMDVALLYDWPGNLRELRNFVTRTIIMRDLDAAVRELEAKIETGRPTTLEEQALSDSRNGSGMRSIMRDVRDRTEAQLIQDALEVVGWNRRHAAQYLNISYRGLLYKIQQHRLTPKFGRELSKGSKVVR